MFEFRDYQRDIIKEGVRIISDHGFLYLAMEVRTGKTLTSLGIAESINCKKVLFLTKKKAISSVENDSELLKHSFILEITNYESMHKTLNLKWDLIICDEAHTMGAFPKPSKRAWQVNDMIKRTGASVILLSGTPTPESYSQMYHQVYGIKKNPFSMFKNFYSFAKTHVKIVQKKMHGFYINDYSNGSEHIIRMMSPFTISYTQKDAGFKVEITEHILKCSMKPSTYSLAKRLKNDLVVQGSEEVILADTAVKLMTKLHQIYSGTVKFESGNSMVLDDSKARFIKGRFKGKKIGIFYKFTEELKALELVFGDDICTDLETFESTNKHIALQIVSGREGISLRQADVLVYYNIDFSATSYWQSRDRMTTKDRTHNDVYWIFSENGIEDDIYKAVKKKKSYTLNHFKKTFMKT
jgi:hypothetical protein|tara:strand:- start:5469 stop:6701 length:1233 start_codon:yes stop_codon:yes gene_type:complete